MHKQSFLEQQLPQMKMEHIVSPQEKEVKIPRKIFYVMGIKIASNVGKDGFIIVRYNLLVHKEFNLF